MDRTGWLELFYQRHGLAQRSGDSPKIGDALIAYDLVTCVRARNGELVPWSKRLGKERDGR